MKTIEQIKTERRDLLKPYTGICSSLIPSKIKRHAALLSLFITYLEGAPTTENLKEQLKSVDNEIAILEARYATWDVPKELQKLGEKAIRKHYDRIMGISDLRRKRLNAKYLLS